MTRPPVTGLLLAALTAVLGCRGEPPPRLVPVEGTVTKGGKPLAGVIVVFWPDTQAGSGESCSSGPTDAAGHFRLRTDQGEEGAVVGRHRVCVVESTALLSRMVGRNSDHSRLPKDIPAAAPPQVSPGYASRDATPLRVEVPPGGLAINIEVK